MNQAVKGIAIAITFVSQRGYVLSARPVFEEVTIREEKTTAMVFLLDFMQ